MGKLISLEEEKNHELVPAATMTIYQKKKHEKLIVYIC
jgi:hypothetical protein